jgi:hypothetical protein
LVISAATPFDQSPAYATVIDDWLHPLLRWRGVRVADISVKIAPDDSWLAIAVANAVPIVAPRTWQTITTLRFECDVDVINAAPNGSWLAIAVDDNIPLWDTDTWTVDTEFADDFEFGGDCALMVTQRHLGRDGSRRQHAADPSAAGRAPRSRTPAGQRPGRLCLAGQRPSGRRRARGLLVPLATRLTARQIGWRLIG